jgi:hypothetical protein
LERAKRPRRFCSGGLVVELSTTPSAWSDSLRLELYPDSIIPALARVIPPDFARELLRTLADRRLLPMTRSGLWRRWPLLVSVEHHVAHRVGLPGLWHGGRHVVSPFSLSELARIVLDGLAMLPRALRSWRYRDW